MISNRNSEAKYRPDLRWVFVFIGAVTGLRLAWHAFGPVGMAGDETYYWMWGQFPDWGFFSKPPLIGWLYGGLDWIFGNFVWGYKAVAALLTAAGLWFFHQLLFLATGDLRLSRWGLICMALLPANLLLASILTIDAPLMACWVAGMFFGLRLIREPNPQTGTIIGLWLAIGIGSLAKQMMMVQIPILLVLILIERRDLLRRPAVWFALLGSQIFLLPPLYWNWQNEWITFAHTSHHFQSAPPTFGKMLQRFGDLWGAMALLVSPLLFFSVFPSIGFAWKNHRDPIVRYFVLLGLAGLAVLTFMTLRQRVNPNWPAVFLPGTLGLILMWAFRTGRERWLRLSMQVAGGFSVFLMIFLLLLEPLSKPLSEIGLKPQLRGWRGYPDMIQRAESMAPEVEQILFVGHRFTASQFAFHLDRARDMHQWNPTGGIVNQFDFFPPLQEGKPTLLVIEQEKPERSASVPIGIEWNPEADQKLGSLPMHPDRDYPLFHIYAIDALRLEAKSSPLDAES